MIPKIIHFIWWQGSNKIPDKFKKNVDSWKIHNKNYKVIVWDCRFFNNILSDYEWSNINKFKYMIQKIDYCKYLLIYNYGGVYVDIDIFCNDSLDNYLLQDKVNVAYMPLIKFYKLINNGFIAADKGNKLIEKVIKECKLNRDLFFITKELTVFRTTGPYLFNSIMNNNYNVNIFDQNIILETDIENSNEGKLGVHYHEFSWISNKFIFIIKMILFCNRNFFRLLFIGLIILFIIYQNAYFFFEIFS